MSRKKKKNKKVEEISEELSVIEDAQSRFAPIPHSDDFTEEDFSESVSALRAEDIEEASDGNNMKKRKRKKGVDFFEIALLCICAAVAAFCIVLLVKNIYGKVRGAELYGDTEFERFTLDTDDNESFNHPCLLSNLTGDTPMLTLYERIAAGKTPENNNGGAYSQKLAAMKASLTALKAKNADIYGWIYVENTGIDYPILQGKNNKYYLDHAYTGESLPIGSIFADYRMSATVTDNKNTVIYGHNVVTGAMFHDVTKFLDADFFAKNKIYIYTMDGVFIYKPISVYPTTDDSGYVKTDFESNAQFTAFAAEIMKRSSVASSEKIEENDTIITLSTCTNGAANGRYALHAKLTETVK